MVRLGWSLVFNGFVLLYCSVSSGYSGKDLWKLKQERPELFGVAPAAARLHVCALCALHGNALLEQCPLSCGTSVTFRVTQRYFLVGFASNETLGVI